VNVTPPITYKSEASVIALRIHESSGSYTIRPSHFILAAHRPTSVYVVGKAIN
jgi:hypothetical protein